MSAPSNGVSRYGDRTFDRVFRDDPANSRYLIRDTVATSDPSKKRPARKSYARQTWLDQGTEGGCTGFSDATALSFAPYPNKNIVNANGEWCYAQAKQYDEYPGIDYEGSSVLGAMQANKANGIIDSYFWAKTVDDVLDAIGLNGVGVFGINWYSGMFTPDSSGIIRITGSLAGGHAITSSAYKKTLGGNILVRLDNTWGKSWAKNGSAWIGADDVTRLLSEDGEFACFVKHIPTVALGSSGRVDPNNNSGGVTGS